MDKHNLSQRWLEETAVLNKETTSKICSDKYHRPNGSTRARVVIALRKEGYKVYEGDFWDD